MVGKVLRKIDIEEQVGARRNADAVRIACIVQVNSILTSLKDNSTQEIRQGPVRFFTPWFG
jgi:hypothetical protein